MDSVHLQRVALLTTRALLIQDSQWSKYIFVLTSKAFLDSCPLLFKVSMFERNVHASSQCLSEAFYNKCQIPWLFGWYQLKYDHRCLNIETLEKIQQYSNIEEVFFFAAVLYATLDCACQGKTWSKELIKRALKERTWEPIAPLSIIYDFITKITFRHHFHQIDFLYRHHSEPWRQKSGWGHP